MGQCVGAAECEGKWVTVLEYWRVRVNGSLCWDSGG